MVHNGAGDALRSAANQVDEDVLVQVNPRVTFTASNLRGKDGDASTHLHPTVSLRKRIQDVDLSFYFTDESVRDVKKLPDALVAADADLGRLLEGLQGQVAYSIGDRSARVRGKYRRAFEGRDLDVQATWLQKGNSVFVEGSFQIDDNNRIRGAYNFGDDALQGRFLHSVNDGSWRGYPVEPPTDPLSYVNGYDYGSKTGVVSYEWRKDEWGVAPLYDFGRNALRLTGSWSREEDSVRATYDVKDEQAAVEWFRAPVRVVASARVNQDGVNNINAGVTVEKAWEF